jgi:putative heme iron utilization protein
MDWVEGRAYAAAGPDPLSEVAPAIVEHMNRDHADSLALFARVLAGEAADEATMLEVDRLGFKLRLVSGGRLHTTRIAFPREVRTAVDARTVLIEMVSACRARGRASP